MALEEISEGFSFEVAGILYVYENKVFLILKKSLKIFSLFVKIKKQQRFFKNLFKGLYTDLQKYIILKDL